MHIHIYVGIYVLWYFLQTMRQNSQFSMCTLSHYLNYIYLLQSVHSENFSDMQGINELFILTISAILINTAQAFSWAIANITNTQWSSLLWNNSIQLLQMHIILWSFEKERMCGPDSASNTKIVTLNLLHYNIVLCDPFAWIE